MNQPTDKQIQWLWEQCGFEYNDDWADDHPYKDPTGTMLHNWKGIDLNNLFKYAVPVVRERFIQRHKYIRYRKEHIEGGLAQFYFKMIGWVEKIVDPDVDPALALFWAIYRAFGGEG